MGNIFSNSSNSSSKISNSSNSSSKSSNSSNSSSKGSNSSASNDFKKGYKSHQELISFSWYDEIKKKLLRDGNSLDIQSETELDKLINSLGDETIFLNRYLKLEEIYNDENLQQIAKDLQEINDLQANNYTPNEEEGRNMINGLLQHRRKSDKFNVYLFINKLEDRSDSPFFRFLAKDVLKNKYGMFHVGLEIDGIVLEWGTGRDGESSKWSDLVSASEPNVGSILEPNRAA
jgi:hypothetical protein